MKKLYVLYDAEEDFALRCYAWLTAQPTVWPLEFVPFQAPELTARFAGIDDFRRRGPLLVVSDEGGVYAGPSAFIICFHALEDYQDWSFRLSAPTLLPLAQRAFNLLSTNGKKLSRVMEKLDDSKTRLAAAISGFDFGAKAHALSMNRTNSESTRPSKAAEHAAVQDAGALATAARTSAGFGKIDLRFIFPMDARKRKGLSMNRRFVLVVMLVLVFDSEVCFENEVRGLNARHQSPERFPDRAAA